MVVQRFLTRSAASFGCGGVNIHQAGKFLFGMLGSNDRMLQRIQQLARDALGFFPSLELAHGTCATGWPMLATTHNATWSADSCLTIRSTSISPMSE